MAEQWRVGKSEAETIGSLSRLFTNTLGHKELADEAEAGILDEELLEILAKTPLRANNR